MEDEVMNIGRVIREVLTGTGEPRTKTPNPEVEAAAKAKRERKAIRNLAIAAKTNPAILDTMKAQGAEMGLDLTPTTKGEIIAKPLKGKDAWPGLKDSGFIGLDLATGPDMSSEQHIIVDPATGARVVKETRILGPDGKPV